MALIRGLEKVLGRGSLLAYLVHMTQRIVEIHRVLKPTGSFYLHCDPTASHYLKLVCDAVFCGQGGDFLNEILWCYKSGGASKNWYARKHDTLFLYCKGKNYTFNPQKEKSYMKPSSGKNPAQTYYKDQDGSYTLVYTKDWWTDIGMLSTDAKERLGYPIQKPESLLERIIRASSNEGDTVLDAYCGCGTTVAVAQRLGRRWIGIDITYQSIALILKRLQDRDPDNWPAIRANLLLDGVPKDFASAQALANRADDKTRKEFEKWAVLTFSDNQARINYKKGGDGGVDGLAYFLKDKGENGIAIFSVKSDKAVVPAYVDQLAGTMAREGAEFGFLLCLNRPSLGTYKRAAANGSYQNPLLRRTDDRVQIVTVEELLAGRRLDLPMARTDAVKSAKARGDGDKQIDLL